MDTPIYGMLKKGLPLWAQNTTLAKLVFITVSGALISVFIKRDPTTIYNRGFLKTMNYSLEWEQLFLVFLKGMFFYRHE